MQYIVDKLVPNAVNKLLTINAFSKTLIGGSIWVQLFQGAMSSHEGTDHSDCLAKGLDLDSMDTVLNESDWFKSVEPSDYDVSNTTLSDFKKWVFEKKLLNYF